MHIPSLANHLWPHPRSHLQASASFFGGRTDSAYNYSDFTRPSRCALLTNIVISRVVMLIAIVLTRPVTQAPFNHRAVCRLRKAPALRYVARPFVLRVIPFVPVDPGAGFAPTRICARHIPSMIGSSWSLSLESEHVRWKTQTTHLERTKIPFIS